MNTQLNQILELIEALRESKERLSLGIQSEQETFDKLLDKLLEQDYGICRGCGDLEEYEEDIFKNALEIYEEELYRRNKDD